MKNELINMNGGAGAFATAKPLLGDADFEEIMRHTGFDFRVRKEPSCFVTEDGPARGTGFQIVTDHDSPRAIGAVGKDYTPIQNEAVFSGIYEAARTFGAKPDQAGIIDGGATCWLSFKLPEAISLADSGRPNDVSCAHILALANHDGTKQAIFKSFATRIVCNNQLRIISSARDAGVCFKVRHSQKSAQRLEMAQNAFRRTLAKADEYQRFCNHLNSVQMTVGEVAEFAERLFPVADESDVSTRTANNRIAIVDLFRFGRGNLGRSRWDALNAVTEFADHHRSTRKTAGRSEADNRFMSTMLGGSGEKLKEKALVMLAG